MKMALLIITLLGFSLADITNEDLLKAIQQNSLDIKVLQSNQTNIIKQMELNRKHSDKRFEDVNSRFSDLNNLLIAIASGFGIVLIWLVNRNDKRHEALRQEFAKNFNLQETKQQEILEEAKVQKQIQTIINIFNALAKDDEKLAKQLKNHGLA